MQKIKQFINETILSEKGKDVLIVCIVILVGLGSFELGRVSKESGSSGIKIEYPKQVETQSANIVSAVKPVPKAVSPTTAVVPPLVINLDTVPKNFFASTRGNKYYSLWCVAGKTIKQENRIYFRTGEEAEKAGYELSSACR